MSKSTRIWSTPQHFYALLDLEFKFTLDACADHQNAKCRRYYTRDVALDRSWNGTVWLNPPYGREISRWMRKALEEANKGNTVVALVPVRSNAPWWHEYVMKSEEIRFVVKKLPYVASDGKRGVPFFGSAVIVFRTRDARRMPAVRSQWQELIP